MSKRKDTLDKTYGNIPGEVGFYVDLEWLTSWRGLKYYWYKLVRRVTR